MNLIGLTLSQFFQGARLLSNEFNGSYDFIQKIYLYGGQKYLYELNIPEDYITFYQNDLPVAKAIEVQESKNLNAVINAYWI